MRRQVEDGSALYYLWLETGASDQAEICCMLAEMQSRLLREQRAFMLRFNIARTEVQSWHVLVVAATNRHVTQDEWRGIFSFGFKVLRSFKGCPCNAAAMMQYGDDFDRVYEVLEAWRAGGTL